MPSLFPTQAEDNKDEMGTYKNRDNYLGFVPSHIEYCKFAFHLFSSLHILKKPKVQQNVSNSSLLVSFFNALESWLLARKVSSYLFFKIMNGFLNINSK